MIAELRNVKAIKNIVGSHRLATASFAKNFGRKSFASYADSTMTTGPLMYDTANQKVQNFRNSFIERFKTSPDWVAAYGYESANVIGQALLKVMKAGQAGVGAQQRKALYEALKDGEPIDGFAGPIEFDGAGAANKPIQVGVYDGRQIISAPTQLQPIAQGEVENYIQAVRDGRALYVNDRFMYKTNVVYSGILVEKVSDYDKAKETIELEFAIWFRYRGDFEPQNVIFDNAVEPVKLDKPDRTETIGDLKYQRYRVKARFETNFMDVRRNYGSKLIGTSFRHQVLNKNNLIYVVDVVGAGLTDGGTYQHRLKEANALGVTLGLVSDRSWISQEIVRASGLGNPTFVGFGKPSPDFSQLGVGIVAVDGAVSLSLGRAADQLSGLYRNLWPCWLYLCHFMDHKRDGQQLFWNLQSWLLRLVCWPLLLSAAGSLVLNFAFQNFEFYYVDMIAPVYEALWWLIGAALVSMAIERFIWTPLEQRAARKVPSSIRAFTKAVVYLFAIFGVIAFVMHKELTSLLATSGLLAMIIGLAIQANVANIFSGIVLNLERPFNVGDVIAFEGGEEAVVTDISWRTIRAIDGLGQLHCIPNSKATEANLIRVTGGHDELYQIGDRVYIDPVHPPEVVIPALLKALKSVTYIDWNKEPARAEIREMVLDNGRPYAQYALIYNVSEYGRRWHVKNELWNAVHRELDAVNVPISKTDALGSGNKPLIEGQAMPAPNPA